MTCTLCGRIPHTFWAYILGFLNLIFILNHVESDFEIKTFSSWLFSVGLVTFESNWIICSRLLSLGQISNTLGFLLRRRLNAKCIAQFLSRRTFPSRIPNIGFCEIVKCTEGHVHSESVNHRWQLWFDAAALMVCALMFNFWNQVNWLQCNLASLFCNVCIKCQFS